ncbi:MAG: DUF3857 domain-containing protein [bacterium]|nr:DUF3857 domain-containing protein [bacterium]
MKINSKNLFFVILSILFISVPLYSTPKIENILALEKAGLSEEAKGHYDKAFALYEKLIRETSDGVQQEIYLRRIFDMRFSISNKTNVLKICKYIRKGRKSNQSLKSLAKWFMLQLYLEDGKIEAAKSLCKKLGFIQNWFAIGPFDNDGKTGFDKEYPPETEIKISSEYQGKDREVKWRHINIESPSGFVDLGAIFRPNKNTCSYLLTFVKSSKKREVAFRMGHDDAIKIWLNNSLVFSNNNYHAARFDQSHARVLLNKGWNKILIKLCQKQEKWGLLFRITSPNGNPISRLKVRANLPAKIAEHVPVEDTVRTDSGSISCLEESIKTDAGNAQLYYYLSYLYNKSLPYDETEHKDFLCITKAIQLNPNNPFYTHLGANLADQPNKRRELLEKTIKLDPYFIIAFYQLAEYYLNADNLTKALHTVNKCLDINPSFLPSICLKISIYSKQGLTPLISPLLEEVKDAPTHKKETRNNIIRYYEYHRSQEETLAQLRKLSEIDFTDNCARDKIVKILLDTSKDSEALNRLCEMSALSPYDTSIYLRRAKIYANRYQFHKAIKVCNQAIIICPENYEILSSLGLLYRRIGNYEKFEGFVNEALKIKPDYTWLRKYAEFVSPKKEAYEENFTENIAAIINSANNLKQTDSEAVYLLDKAISRVYMDGTSSEYIHQVIKILTDKGVRDFNHLNIYYVPGDQEVIIKKACIIKKDGTIRDYYKFSDVSTSSPQYRTYYDYRRKTIKFSSLEKGDIIDFEYNVNDIGGNIYGDYFGNMFLFKDTNPIIFSKYILIAPKRRKFYFYSPKLHIIPRKIYDKHADTISYIWEKRNIGKIDKELSMPPYQEITPYLLISTFKDWTDMARWYADLTRDQMESSPEIKKIVASLTENKNTEIDKIEAIYNYVVKKIRYVALEFGIHGYKPYKACQVFSRKFGDCKDKALLIMTMLKEAGIPSEIVLVRTRSLGRFDFSQASLGLFNHAICHIRLKGGKELWLDGTAEYSSINEIPWMDQGARVFVVDLKRRKGILSEIPVSAGIHNNRISDKNVLLKNDGSAYIGGTEIVSGAFCSGIRYFFQIPSKQKEEFEKLLNTVFEGVQVINIHFPDLSGLDTPIKYNYAVSVPKFLKPVSEGFSFNPVMLRHKLTQRYASSSIRKHDFLLSYPFMDNKTTEFLLPQGYEAIHLPQDVELKSKFGSLSMIYGKLPDKIIVKIKLQLDVSRVLPEEYSEFRKFVADVDKNENKEIIIKKIPVAE